MDRKYYAANMVDQFVKETFFPNKKDGYFVDIGAHNGIDVNNTYFFEEEGWDGICFEPIFNIFKDLERNRKCKTINKALSDVEGELDFFYIKGYSEMLSGLTKEYPEEHIIRINKEIEERNQSYDYIKVKSSLFGKEIEERNIDLLSIDTEGAELTILKTIDFTKYKIKIIVVEYNYHNQDLLNLLNDNNFEIVKQQGHDLIVKNKNFNFPI